MILEVDHIIPVAKGGDNEPLNLVTSCRDCNRGKGKKELSDQSTIKAQKQQLDDLNEKRIQLEMIIEWKRELMELQDRQVEAASDLFQALTGSSVTETGKTKLLKKIKEFGFSLVYRSIEITVNTYFKDTPTSASYAFSKIGGICYNIRKRENEDGA